MASRFPRAGWLILVFVLGIFVTAYLSSFVFHSGESIRLIDLYSFDATNPQLSLLETEVCTNRFCSAVCPAGYVALTGRCSSSGGRQWNLQGTSSDYKSWNCFDSSLLNAANIPLSANPPIVVAEASCVELGSSYTGSPPKLGNYLIESGEVCDLNNTGSIDCTDFISRQWDETNGAFIDVPLCNGWLTCNASGTAYDISHCQYCNSDGNPNGIPVGNGSACSGSNCFCLPGSSGSCPASQIDPVCGNAIIESGEECESPNRGLNVNIGGILYFCGLDCKMGAVPLGSGGSGGTCGDGILQGSEDCDPPGTTALTGSSALCPAGYCIYETATCQPDCTWKTDWPSCGGGAGTPIDSSGSGGGTCINMGPQSLPRDV